MTLLASASETDQTVLLEIANLGPKSPRSKPESHRELIRDLRREGRSYREIARLFEERLDLSVAPALSILS
jgi:hypothetical protein